MILRDSRCSQSFVAEPLLQGGVEEGRRLPGDDLARTESKSGRRREQRQSDGTSNNLSSRSRMGNSFVTRIIIVGEAFWGESQWSNLVALVRSVLILSFLEESHFYKHVVKSRGQNHLLLFLHHIFLAPYFENTPFVVQK